MAYTEPIVLKECIPLTDVSALSDEQLQDAAQMWMAWRDEQDGVPRWDMNFALQNANLVSRSILYDLNAEDVFVTLVGDQCREFIGLDKTKGALSDLIPKINADDVRKRLNVCIEQHAPNSCLKSMSWNHGKDFVKYEALFLPFLGNGDACAWVLCPMAFYIGEEGEEFA